MRLYHRLPPPPIRKSSSREPSREPSPGVSSVTVRETETFKLVRTKSGNVMTVSETIPAAGEQWEVEEVSQSKRASKSKDKDKSSSSKSERDADGRERDARRESRRQEKKAERSSRSHTRHSVDDLPVKYSDKPIGRSSSLESHHRAPIPESMRQQDDARSGRVRNGEHKSTRKTSASASPTKPSTRPRERTSSKSSRPTSEVPSAADLNALRAREAWDMERLYKGRSMYGMDANVETMAPAPPVPVSSTSMSNGSTDLPFDADSASANHLCIYKFTIKSASVSSPPPPDFFPRAPNPLPEPPRETPTPPRISQTFSDNKNGRPTEYWTTYAEVH
ncbi:hypothetical protein BT96DRAFT_992850 [Gymnopus androsaceus JB14]|uniref:Uncharacterized protein n=1 Tax=Gymnopus androsaceus JB14 TaxID=1447944 RepID=A0A6A4HV42_9AGAR|nr:hypothetical protein BT96DRAFT_992850 [Gymnopus androsaceus JB14]